MIDYEYYEQLFEALPRRDGNNFFTTCNYKLCCIGCDGNQERYPTRRCWKNYRNKQYKISGSALLPTESANSDVSSLAKSTGC